MVLQQTLHLGLAAAANTVDTGDKHGICRLLTLIYARNERGK